MLQAVGAERAILSILIKEPLLLFEVDDILGSEDFTNTGAAVIYSLIKDIVVEDKSSKIDPFTLISRAEQKGIKDFLQITHNGDLLEALNATVVHPSTLNKHVGVVKTMSTKRQMIGLLDSLKDDIEGSAGDSIDIKNMVEDVVYRNMHAMDNYGEEIECLADTFESTINSYADFANLIGLDVGLPRWQRDVGALRNGTVTGLFARAKAGKSQFAAHCAVQIAIKQKLPVLYLDTELQLRMQQMRVCGILSNIPYERIESGAWKSKPDEVAKIKDAFAIVKGSPFHYKNIAGRSVNYVIPIIRKWFHKFIGESPGDAPRGLVIYDYIKLMDSGDLKDAAEYQVLGFLISAIHDVAAQLNIPVLCLGQLNREAIRIDSEGTVAGSDRITHNLDSLTIMRPKRLDELEVDGTQRGNYIFKGLLARSGPGHDNDCVNMFFDKGSGQFKEDKRASEVIAAIQGITSIRDRLAELETSPLGNINEDG